MEPAELTFKAARKNVVTKKSMRQTDSSDTSEVCPRRDIPPLLTPSGSIVPGRSNRWNLPPITPNTTMLWTYPSFLSASFDTFFMYTSTVRVTYAARGYAVVLLPNSFAAATNDMTANNVDCNVRLTEHPPRSTSLSTIHVAVMRTKKKHSWNLSSPYSWWNRNPATVEQSKTKPTFVRK